MARAAQCPNCRKEVAPRKENPAFPFCSARCRAVDLGRWLGEEYRIGDRPEEREGEGPPLEDKGPFDA